MSTNNVSNVAMSVKANRFNRTSTSRKGRRESNNLPAPNPAHVSPRMRVTSSDSKTDSSVDRQEAEGALGNMVANSMGVEVSLDFSYLTGDIGRGLLWRNFLKTASLYSPP